MGRFLNSAENRRALAERSGVSEKEFAVAKVGPVRGTKLFDIECSAVDSNKLERVASNAAQLIVLFCATNQPSWQVTYMETICFTPPSFWERLKEMKEMILSCAFIAVILGVVSILIYMKCFGAVARKCKIIEVEVRRQYEKEFSATTDYWRQMEIEDKIRKEVKLRLKQEMTVNK
jgi:hypothetical protein